MFTHEENAENEEMVQNKLVIAINGMDQYMAYSQLGLSFESSSNEILEAVRPIVQEGFKVDIRDEYNNWLYKVTKTTNNQNIYIIPNSTAGLRSIGRVG